MFEHYLEMAKSKTQLRMIYGKRKQYGSKNKAPKDWKWVFDKKWGELEPEAPEKIEESILDVYLKKINYMEVF